LYSDRLSVSLVKNLIFIPVTRKVKGYTRFVGKYVTRRRKRFRPHKVYIFLIRTTSRKKEAFPTPKVYTWSGDHCESISSHVRLSVRPSVRMNAEISETMREGYWDLAFRFLSFLLGYWDLACRFLSFLLSASLFQ